MRIRLFADPHLGLNRVANTTPASRKWMRELLFRHTAKHVIWDPNQHPNICLGDLFDKYSNNETVLWQGAEVVQNCKMVLAGNHDVRADKTSMSSIQLLSYYDRLSNGMAANFEQNKIVIAPFMEHQVAQQVIGKYLLVGVPHHTTQELFEESLVQAKAIATQTDIPYKVLLLHCNYESPYVEDREAALNITEEQVAHLLDRFDYIFLGHEHNYRTLFGGKLVILGNMHPTGFSDISDKWIAYLEEDGSVTYEKVWDKETGYAVYQYDQVPGSTEAAFVTIEGQAPYSALADVAKSVSTLWANSENLLCLRSHVETVTDSIAESVAPGIAGETLPQLIGRELREDPALFALWEELSDTAN